MFNWTAFESEIQDKALAILNAQPVNYRVLLNHIKSEIKQYTAAARTNRIAEREWRKVNIEWLRNPGEGEHTPWPVLQKLPIGNYMRHLFLVYGWLRGRPLSVVESKAKDAAVRDYWSTQLPVGGNWVGYDKNPSTEAFLAFLQHFINCQIQEPKANVA